MRIALICSDKGPCPPVKGGAIQLLISRVAPILARKHDVTVFSITDPALPAREIYQGVNYKRFPQKTFLDHVCKKIAGKNFDVIQVFNRPEWIPKLRKTSHDSAIILSLHNLFRTLKADKATANTGLIEADKVLTVSRFVAKDVLKQFPQLHDKVQALYTGVDLNEYAPVWSKKGQSWRNQIRRRYGIADTDPVLLFVGRLVPYKGAHLLVDSMETILKSHGNARLLIVGSKWYADNSPNPYIKQLKKTARKISKHVIFTSYVPVKEIPKYYAAADLFICASQWQEPLARVHYEAMAAGIPIITTHRGGNREVIDAGKNGVVIKDYENPMQFAKESISLLSNEQRRHKMGMYGRRLVQKFFNFDRVADDLHSVYQSLIK